MNSTTRFYRNFKKATLTGCLTLSLTASGIFSGAAFAGPADDPVISTQPVGPGQGPGQTAPGQPVQPTQPVYINPQYYELGLTNPIVNPVDKYSYEQMEYDMVALATRYPGRVTIAAIGQSWDGRTIYDFIIGNPNAKKKILFQGAIHAREYVTVPIMMQQMEYLLAFYDSGFYNDKALSAMMSDVAFHFVPMSNPDGVALSQFGEGAIRSQDLRTMIQTCYAMDVAEGRTSYTYDQYLSRWKSNAYGVDLNHNFDAGWASLTGTTRNAGSDYRGTAPLSEPEAQALANLVNQQNFSAVINYHSMGRVIYWDTLNNQQAAASLGLAQSVSAFNGYQILSSKGVGGLKDWLQQRSNPVAGITIEVGRSAAPVPFSEYPSIWEQNRAIPGIILDYVLQY